MAHKSRASRADVTHVTLAAGAEGAFRSRGGGAGERSVTAPPSGRGAPEVLDLVAVGARELQLVPALECEEVFAVHVRTQALHQAQVDDGGTVHALEQFRIEQLLELLHRAAQD